MYDLSKVKAKDYKSVNLRKSIKSIYNVKKIFSHLYEKKKLDIIIYNKNYQKLFGISIENYKKLSGKYVVCEKNGIRKEYLLNTNELIFEGEYLNGKRNGKVKEYKNGKLIFEGESLNGKRNGKGKEYFE